MPPAGIPAASLFCVLLSMMASPARALTTAQSAAATAALRISGTPPKSVEAGRYYYFVPTVVAPKGSTLTYAIANKPSWAKFNARKGSLSGAPSARNVGTDVNIVVSVSDGHRRVGLAAFDVAIEPAAAPTTGVADVSWTRPMENTDGSVLGDLAGYVIRFGSSAGALNHQISVASAKATNATIESLSPGAWYFEIAAVNREGIRSEFSRAVSAIIR